MTSHFMAPIIAGMSSTDYRERVSSWEALNLLCEAIEKVSEKHKDSGIDFQMEVNSYVWNNSKDNGFKEQIESYEWEE